MRKTISPLISEAQNRLLKDTAQYLINGTDLNLEGSTLSNQEPFVLDGTAALQNKVILWLLSTNGDYIREPEKSGPLYAVLGRPLNEDTAEDIQTSIRLGFENMFSVEFSLIDVRVVPDPQARRWVIGIDALDRISREYFDIALGVPV